MKIHGQYTFWVDAQMHRQLNSYCALHGVQRSIVMRQAIAMFLRTQVEEALAQNTTKPAAQAGSARQSTETT